MEQQRKFQREVKTLSTKDIFVDQRYQRDIRQAQINRALKNYDANLVNMPKVSYRDGKYWVFDGQHTITIERMHNGGAPVDILCEVFYGMSWEDEAKYYTMQNGVESNPNANEKLKARYNLGEEKAVSIVNGAERAGFTVNLHTATAGTGSIACAAALEKVYDRLGMDGYIKALKVIRNAWDGEKISLSADIVMAVGVIVQTYGEEIDLTRLSGKLRKSNVEDIKRRAGGGGYKTIARVMIDNYNQCFNRSSPKRLAEKI